MRGYLTSYIQPLIDVLAVRAQIPWINVYLPWNIVSDHFDFYADPQRPGIQVQNERDPEAVTLFGVQTEYWQNWLVFERLHKHLRLLLFRVDMHRDESSVVGPRTGRLTQTEHEQRSIAYGK